MLDSILDLRLPYITNKLPGIGGVLRTTPDHFVVEELPLYAPSGEGQHLYVNLTKVGLTTKDVQVQLGRLFGLRSGDVGCAGLKDKQARTTQTFSLNVGHHPSDAIPDMVARIQDALGLQVHWAAFHRNKLKAGHLLGNRFTITVTELACGAEEAQARAAAIIAKLQTQGLPNYFGPQRFGSGGDNVRTGMEILLGERRKADRWLRGLLIAAYQSYLCNRYLAARVEMGAFDHLLTGDVAKKHATGGMFDVVDAEVEQPRYAAQEISFTAPMYGSKMWGAKGEAAALEAAILAQGPVTVEHFAAARVEGTRRLGRLLLPEFAAAWDGEALGLRVTFSLPKGAFATTVLRELMKVDLAQTPEIDDDEGS